MHKESLRDIQLAELNILREMKRLCERHNLRYFLIGGTALGAVRHSGFIPWDDDIDIGMPRSDYNKFINICAQELDSRYFLQTKKTDENYMYQFAKIRMNNSTFLQEELKNFKIHHGIFIDVFPLDAIPISSLKRKFQNYGVFIFGTIREMKIQKKNKTLNKSFGIKRIIRNILSVCSWNLIDKSIKWIITHEKAQTSFIANILGCAGYEKEIFPVEYFEKAYQINFEGELFPITSEYHKYLTGLYGDYMELPPLHKRKTHNPMIVSLSEDYKKFII
ncbi:LicD family protein [Paenibacillus phytohabitans]|uniref:LicD family protein n=1 Tax=Paenibacillus phytohabitans TaxID=2654978 RepID=UPI00300A81D9